MNSLRITVLEMLAEGRLSIDDAERLLASSMSTVVPRRRVVATKQNSHETELFLPPVLPTRFSGADIQIM